MKNAFTACFLGILIFACVFVIAEKFDQKQGLGTNEVVVHDEVVPPPVDVVIDLDGHQRQYSANLSAHAQEWAEQMAKQNSFYHSHIGILTSRHGVVRENIAYYQGPAASWENVYEMFKASPPHDFNIKNGGPYIGYGEAANGGTTYYVVLYGTTP